MKNLKHTRQIEPDSTTHARNAPIINKHGKPFTRKPYWQVVQNVATPLIFIIGALTCSTVQATDNASLTPVAQVKATDKADESTVKSPWAFDLKLYLWLPAVDGNFSAGRFNMSSYSSFVNLMENQRNFPMAFNGHFEAHYERLGFYLDGNYFGLDFNPKLDSGIGSGLSTRLGIMDYGVSYRLFGESAAERVNNWGSKPYATVFDIYVGGRSIWLGNSAEFVGIGNVSSSSSASAPVLGARITTDISPKWFVHIDGSVGGFGVDNVNFTSSALGTVGYRTNLFGVPSSVEVGYKELSVKVSRPVLTADVVLHGAFIGLTGYW